jgi:hypothetical protein
MRYHIIRTDVHLGLVFYLTDEGRGYTQWGVWCPELSRAKTFTFQEAINTHNWIVENNQAIGAIYPAFEPERTVNDFIILKKEEADDAIQGYSREKAEVVARNCCKDNPGQAYVIYQRVKGFIVDGIREIE